MRTPPCRRSSIQWIIPVVSHENELLGGLTKSGLLATLSKRYRRDSTEGAEE